MDDGTAPLGFVFADFGGATDFEFCLDGFEPSSKVEPTETAIFNKPIVFTPQECSYEYAEDFARAVDLANGRETFAFVSGNFVFGDFVEALVDLGKLSVRRMGIQTLSLNDENIDSIRNIVEMEGVERLDLVLSDYWYAHERKEGGLVGYLFEELDLDGLDLHVAFCGTHAKVWTIETRVGNVLTVHGSANLRSSGNIEQVCISPDRGLYEFCQKFLERMVDVYDVVNQDARKRKSVRRSRLWQAVAVAEAEDAEARAAGARARAQGSAESAGRERRRRGVRGAGTTSTGSSPSSEVIKDADD